MKFLGGVNSHYTADMDRETFDRQRHLDGLDGIFLAVQGKVPNWSRLISTLRDDINIACMNQIPYGPGKR